MGNRADRLVRCQFGPGTLEWNGGLLFGLTLAAPRETLRWQAEHEIRC